MGDRTRKMKILSKQVKNSQKKYSEKETNDKLKEMAAKNGGKIDSQSKLYDGKSKNIDVETSNKTFLDQHHRPTGVPTGDKGKAALQGAATNAFDDDEDRTPKPKVTKTTPVTKAKDIADDGYEPLLNDDGSYASDTKGNVAKELAGKGSSVAKEKDLNRKGDTTFWNTDKSGDRLYDKKKK